MPPFSHVPHVFYLHPTGNAGYGYYIRISFGDMTNVFFLPLLLLRLVDNYPPPLDSFIQVLLIKHA
jgi:hypothetical protein